MVRCAPCAGVQNKAACCHTCSLKGSMLPVSKRCRLADRARPGLDVRLVLLQDAEDLLHTFPQAAEDDDASSAHAGLLRRSLQGHGSPRAAFPLWHPEPEVLQHGALQGSHLRVGGGQPAESVQLPLELQQQMQHVCGPDFYLGSDCWTMRRPLACAMYYEPN